MLSGGCSPAKEQDEHGVPVAAHEVLVLAVDRVHCLSLVELEHALAVWVLDHAGVLVLGLLLPDHLATGGDRLRQTHRDEHEACYGDGHHGRDQPPPPESRYHHEREDQGVQQEAALRPDQRDEQQGGRESPDQRADRADRGQPTSHLPGVADLFELEPHGVRRDHAEQQERQGDEHAHSHQRSDEQPARELLERRH